LLLAGCSNGGDSSEAASVNGETITVGQLDAAMDEIIEAWDDPEFGWDWTEADLESARVQQLSGLIFNLRFEQVAAEAGIEVSEDVVDARLAEPHVDFDWDTEEEVSYDTYEEFFRSQDWFSDEQTMRDSVRSELLHHRIDLYLQSIFLSQASAEMGVEISQGAIDGEVANYRAPGSGHGLGFETFEDFLHARGYSEDQVREHAHLILLNRYLREGRFIEWARDEGIEITDADIDEFLQSFFFWEEEENPLEHAMNSFGVSSEAELRTTIEFRLAEERLASHLINDEDARVHWEENRGEDQVELDEDGNVIAEVIYEFGEWEMQNAKVTLLRESDKFQEFESIGEYDFSELLFAGADIRVSDPVVRNWLENNEPDEWTFNFEWQ